jgi:hypothetical protein
VKLKRKYIDNYLDSILEFKIKGSIIIRSTEINNPLQSRNIKTSVGSYAQKLNDVSKIPKEIRDIASKLISTVLGKRVDKFSENPAVITINTNHNQHSYSSWFNPEGDDMRSASNKTRDLIKKACTFWKEASNGKLNLKLLSEESIEVPDIVFEEGILAEGICGIGSFPSPLPSHHPLTGVIDINCKVLDTVIHELGHNMGLPHVNNPNDIIVILKNEPQRCIPKMTYDSIAKKVAKDNKIVGVKSCNYPSKMDRSMAEVIYERRKGLFPDAFPTSPTLYCSTYLLKSAPAGTSHFLYKLCEKICNKRNISLNNDSKRQLQLGANMIYTGLTYAISGPVPSIMAGVSSAVAYTGKVNAIDNILKKSKLGSEISELLDYPAFTIGLTLALSFIQALQYTSPLFFIIDRNIQNAINVVVVILAAKIGESIGNLVPSTETRVPINTVNNLQTETESVANTETNSDYSQDGNEFRPLNITMDSLINSFSDDLQTGA